MDVARAAPRSRSVSGVGSTHRAHRVRAAAPSARSCRRSPGGSGSHPGDGSRWTNEPRTRGTSARATPGSPARCHHALLLRRALDAGRGALSRVIRVRRQEPAAPGPAATARGCVQHERGRHATTRPITPERVRRQGDALDSAGHDRRALAGQPWHLGQRSGRHLEHVVCRADGRRRTHQGAGGQGPQSRPRRVLVHPAAALCGPRGPSARRSGPARCRRRSNLHPLWA